MDSDQSGPTPEPSVGQQPGADPGTEPGATPGSGSNAGPQWTAPTSSFGTPSGSPPGQPGSPWGAAAAGQGPAGAGGSLPGQFPVQPSAQVPPGWYPDPWYGGQQRYWDGRAWTGHAFPESAGPTGAGGQPAPSAPSVAPPQGPKASVEAPPPPEWRPPTAWAEAPPIPIPVPSVPQKEPFWTWPPKGRALVALLIILAFIVGGIGGLIASKHKDNNNALAPGSPGSGATPAPSPSPSDPSSSVLRSLVLQQSDVGATETVDLPPGGSGLSVATLDLCNGTYPSDSLRTARLQVDGVDDANNVLLSTEAVLYQSPSATAQAFSELTSTVQNCPAGPVVSPVGEPPIQTTFGPTPDGSWPQVAGVIRQAYAFNTVDSSGNVQPAVAVYLRRGRALLGVYFYTPANQPQSPVDDQTTMAGIVNVFATRLAQIPASQIGA